LFLFSFLQNNVENWRLKIGVLLSMLAVMLICAGVDMGMSGQLHKFGIYPRSLVGLWGIPVAPFLHVSLSHLVINALPLLILGAFVLMRARGVAIFSYLVATIAVLGGIGVWAFGEEHLHTGSSVLVFGFFGYLLVMGAIALDWRSTVTAVVVFVIYGTTLISMFTQVRRRGT